MIVTSIDQIINRIKQGVEETIDALGPAVLEAVKDKTPVKTGHAKDGWTLAQKNPLQADVTNDVPYIGELEYGNEHREGAAMVRQTMMNAPKLINDSIPDHD